MLYHCQGLGLQGVLGKPRSVLPRSVFYPILPPNFSRGRFGEGSRGQTHQQHSPQAPLYHTCTQLPWKKHRKTPIAWLLVHPQKMLLPGLLFLSLPTHHYALPSPTDPVSARATQTMRHDNDDDDDAGEEEEEDDDIQDEADRGFLTHAHGSLLASSLSGGGGLESTSSGAGAKVIVHLGA